jgi:hypothetical protein
MLHTAIVDGQIASVVITFNCADPANSVTQTYGPGTYTDPDSCNSRFVSATILGTTIVDGATGNVQIGGKNVHVSVTTAQDGRHITVDLSVDLG